MIQASYRAPFSALPARLTSKRTSLLPHCHYVDRLSHESRQTQGDLRAPARCQSRTRGELEYPTPSSCWSPSCCRRRPPTRASTSPRASSLPGANTPAAISRSASDGLDALHQAPSASIAPRRRTSSRPAASCSSSTAAKCRDREALEALPGVGRKTANVVLNTAFGEPTIAVDTHIFRVANRTGLAPGKDVRRGRRKA